MRVGTPVTQVRQFLGRRFETGFEVTEFEPYRRSAVPITAGPIKGGGSYTLERVDDRTRFTATFELDAHGFFKLAEPIFARATRRELATNLGHLRDLLETEGASG